MWNSTNLRLPLNDVNILAVTDVHSWIASHLPHEPYLNVDYGHVLSFYLLLRKACEEKELDLYFVMNGDFVDGTGLSTVPPSHLVPLLERMPWDAVNIGNHELYHSETVDLLLSDFVPHWGSKYLTTNVVMLQNSQPIGHRYTILQGTHGRLLTFGFLFDFTNNCNTTKVEPVETVVRSDWFLLLLNEQRFDAVLVMAHMDANDPLVLLILDAIREVIGPHIIVQFITGHSHLRKFALLDDYSSSLEAGRYLDTLGFVSFPLVQNNASYSSLNKTTHTDNVLFQHVFLDANVNVLLHALGDDNDNDNDKLETPQGLELSTLIHETQISMGLLNVIGCSPRFYNLSRGMDNDDSLWGLYLKQIVPQQLFVGGEGNQVLIQNIGTFRYDLFEGSITVTDFQSVSPYNDTLYLVATRIVGRDIVTAFGEPNSLDHHDSYFTELPHYAMAMSTPSLNHDESYDVYSIDFDATTVAELLTKANNNQTVIVPTKLKPQTTINSLWLDYIATNWKCDSEHDNETNTFSSSNYQNMAKSTWSSLTLCLVAVLVTIGWKLNAWRRRRNMRYYEEAVSIEAFEEEADDTFNSRIC